MNNGFNGDLQASPIAVEPTTGQIAAHKLREALTASSIDWELVESVFTTLVEQSGYQSPVLYLARTAAARIHEAMLTGRQIAAADLDAVWFAIDETRTATLELEDGMPIRYWQPWLIESWLPANCVGMLTGDGGVGKSRLALQLAWAISGDGQWLGEEGQMPPLGADYGLGFEPLGPRKVVYATWEDSPAQMRGRLFWLAHFSKVGDGRNFKIADMRSRGHIWGYTDRGTTSGLTAAGQELRLAAERQQARLLVIDTLGAAYGASEIDRAQVGSFFADWAGWADERACTVLLIAHPPKTPGVAYSGSTGILGGVRAMWNIESVRQGCRDECGSPKTCRCEPAHAYRLVNAKQNYMMRTGSVWLTNKRGVWIESPNGAPDYGEDARNDLFKKAI